MEEYVMDVMHINKIQVHMANVHSETGLQVCTAAVAWRSKTYALRSVPSPWL